MEALQPIFTFRLKEGTISRYSCNLCPKDTRIALIRNDALEKHLQSKHSKDDCDQYDEILKKNKSQGILPPPALKPRTLFDDIWIVQQIHICLNSWSFELSTEVPYAERPFSLRTVGVASKPV